MGEGNMSAIPSMGRRAQSLVQANIKRSRTVKADGIAWTSLILGSFRRTSTRLVKKSPREQGGGDIASTSRSDSVR
jgi:hypothetical protein